MYDDGRLREYRLKYLRENRPAELNRLEAAGELEQHLDQKVAACRADAERLVKRGQTFPAQAWRWAIRRYLLETDYD